MPIQHVVDASSRVFRRLNDSEARLADLVRAWNNRNVSMFYIVILDRSIDAAWLPDGRQRATKKLHMAGKSLCGLIFNAVDLHADVTPQR